jgi:hypothetical protein
MSNISEVRPPSRKGSLNSNSAVSRSKYAERHLVESVSGDEKNVNSKDKNVQAYEEVLRREIDVQPSEQSEDIQ